MGDETNGSVDVVVFFDANMPKLDECDEDCIIEQPKLCIHRFLFQAYVVPRGNSLEGLDDFEVLQYCFKLIEKTKNWQNRNRKPLFVLITRDHNFLKKDAPEAYREASLKQKNKLNLTFHDNCVSDGKYNIRVLFINPKLNRTNNLHATIDKLNELWIEIKTQDSE